MKIGLVCPYNIFKGGGVQECVTALGKELSTRGHDVRILTPLPRENNAKSPENVIFIGTAADVKSPFHTTGQVSVSLNNEMLEQVLDKERFDVLHFHEPWVPFVSRQILGRSKSVNVATFHAKLPGTTVSRTLEKVITPYTKSIMKYLDCLTAVSDVAAEYVQTLTDEPVYIIPNGIDIKKYKPKTTTQTNNSILYVGRLERRKGLKYLLQAFQKLVTADPTLQLQIAGDGSDRLKLETYVSENNIPNVTFYGFVTEKEKLNLLAQAGVFCSPAIYGESFGIVLLEAMAMNLPVVAGNNPGYASVLKDRGTVSLVNPKDINEFASKLKLMLHDQELRHLWQKWAKSYVQQFSYKQVVDEYENLYLKSCGK